MAFRVVLDADVLFRLPVCDTLLRLAELELCDPCWSERILDEMVRNLVETDRATEDAARRRARLMGETFEAADVPASAIAKLEPSMTNDPKDRHVLAAAVAAGAQVIVTCNLSDFPNDACEPFGIEARHPDEFLMNLYELAPDKVRAVVEEQAAALTGPVMTVDEVLDALSDAVPNFADAVRSHRS